MHTHFLAFLYLPSLISILNSIGRIPITASAKIFSKSSSGRFGGDESFDSDLSKRFFSSLSHLHEENLVRCAYASLRSGLPIAFSKYESYLYRCSEFFIDIDISHMHQIVVKVFALFFPLPKMFVLFLICGLFYRTQLRERCQYI
jgi:hypothetical protein